MDGEIILMPEAKRHIIFQAYGQQDILNECVFALLSLSRTHGTDAAQWANTEIWINTDQPDFFRSFADCPLPLHYRTIDAAIIRQWRGDIDFTHRVKIELLKDLTAQAAGSFLYIDTDAVIGQSLVSIFEDIDDGALYMHIAEGSVQTDSNQPLLKKLAKFIQSSATTIQQKGIFIPEQPMMCNAGVLGFNSNHIGLLQEALQITDAFYPLFPKHIVEQFAFSLIFQKTGAVHPAAHAILHYWNLKELRQVLAAFFSRYEKENWNVLVEKAGQINVPALMQDKISFLQNLSVWDKLNKKRWQPEMPLWT